MAELKRAMYVAQTASRPDVAGNGLEAIEALQRQSYDVVLLDVQMPPTRKKGRLPGKRVG